MAKQEDPRLKGMDKGWTIEGEIVAARMDMLTIRTDDGQTLEFGKAGASLFGNATFGRVRITLKAKMLETAEERMNLQAEADESS